MKTAFAFIVRATALLALISALTAHAAANRSLVNLSVRGRAGMANPANLRGAFTIEGAASKTILVRAVGPTLANFGVSGVLPDPLLRVFDGSGAQIASNNDWGSAATSPQIAAAATQVGAFGLPDGSKDAVLLLTLPPGTYSASVDAATGGPGQALLEVYDTEPTARLVSLMTSNNVWSASEPIMAGFTVSGSTPQTFLIRALGPSTRVPGPSLDPLLTIYSMSGNQVAVNDNWSAAPNAADIAAATATAGLMPITVGSTDAAVLVTLAPGAYTARVSPSTAGSGFPFGFAQLEVAQIDADRVTSAVPALYFPIPSTSANQGSSTSFRIFTYVGIPNDLSFQWRRNGNPIAGATGTTLQLNNVQLSDAGSYSVDLINAAGTQTSAGAILSVYVQPQISSFTPTVLAAGAQVTINGLNFNNVTAVRFNGVDAASYNVVSSSQITAVVPNVTLTPGPIQVTAMGSTVNSPSSFTLGPKITSFTPTAISPGTSVTINGSNFTNVTSVQFNGIAAASYVVASSAQIVATVPNANLVPGPVTVVANGMAANSPVQFTIASVLPAITSFFPSTIGVGSTVTINGTNLSGVTTVLFNGVPAENFSVFSSGSISARVPNAALSSGPIMVETATASATSSSTFTVLNAAPVFSTNLRPAVTSTGGVAMLSVNAVGGGPITYQWYLDGVPLAGATSNQLRIENASSANAGSYTVVATNPYGSMTSVARSVTVAEYEPYAIDTLAGSPSYGAADGAGIEARIMQPWGVAVDAAGNAYIADTMNHTIRKVTPEGVVSTVAGSAGRPGSADGPAENARFQAPAGVAIDGAGYLYVADAANCTVRKISPEGVVSTLAGTAGHAGHLDGSGPAARFTFPYGIAVDANNWVYVSDQATATIRRISPDGIVSTWAGFPGAVAFADGPGAAARFRGPSGICLDTGGNLYVADRGNYCIRKVTPAGVVSTVAGTPGLSGFTDGSGTAARFIWPLSVSADPAGTLYVADSVTATIRKITANGTVSTLAGAPFSSGTIDGVGAQARFNSPNAVAAASDGRLIVAEASAIRTVTDAGLTATLAGSPWRVGSLDGVQGSASFNSPGDVDVDAAGNVYVADTNNHIIRKITPAGVVTTLAGSPGMFGTADGSGAAARFNNPRGLTVDETGVVYVADSGNHTIRKIDLDGVVSTVAGVPGPSGAGAVDGPASTAKFRSPYDVAVDATGAIYVADQGNNTIRRIAPDAVVSTLAGVAQQSGSIDGTGAAARFSGLSTIDVAADATLVVAERTGNVRRITPDGVVTTLATITNLTSAAWNGDSGSIIAVTANALWKLTLPDLKLTALAGIAGGLGSADGVGSEARFNVPAGVAVAGDGVVYIADTNNSTIRRGRLADQVAPTVSAAVTPEPNGSGWNREPVTVVLSAVDNAGGSGVAGIGAEIEGAQTGTFAVAADSLTVPVTSEGVSTLHYFATDKAGNSSSPQSRVFRLDFTAPAFTAVSASPATLWPVNGRMVPVTVSADTTDLSGVVSTSIVSVTSSEPVAADASDWVITGPLSVDLRAKRSGAAGDRVYTLTLESRDAAGNVGTRMVVVTVPHDQGR